MRSRGWCAVFRVCVFFFSVRDQESIKPNDNNNHSFCAAHVDFISNNFLEAFVSVCSGFYGTLKPLNIVRCAYDTNTHYEQIQNPQQTRAKSRVVELCYWKIRAVN